MNQPFWAKNEFTSFSPFKIFNFHLVKYLLFIVVIAYRTCVSACGAVMFCLSIKYAKTKVADLETPIKQCTRTFPKFINFIILRKN